MAVGIVDLYGEGERQLDRATRLLEIGSSASRGIRAPVHKSLEQLFGEARFRSQPDGAFGGGAFNHTGALSQLLQGPLAQRLERDVADFSLLLGPAVTIIGGDPGGDVPAEERVGLDVWDFFNLRHERTLLSSVEEAHYDCLRSFEHDSFESVKSDWDDVKAQMMGNNSSQRGASGAVGSAMQRGAAGGALPPAPGVLNREPGLVVVPPPQDTAIISALLGEPLNQLLVQRIRQLSCESCMPYQGELAECWGIVGHTLEASPRAVTCGSLTYLQDRFLEEMRATVYRSADAHLGGVPDEWSLVRAFGRVKFETANFPSVVAHVWYAAYVAARAGLVHLLVDLPREASPYSERAPMLRTVCALMARRLQATASTLAAKRYQPLDFAALGNVDEADLLRADLTEEGNGFHDVLVSLLLGRNFSLGRLPEGTVEDWLWFRLHAMHLAAGDSDQEPFGQHLEALRQHVLAMPPSHFDPVSAASGVMSARSAPSQMLGDFGAPFAYGNEDAPLGMSTGQTLNLVKVLFLTGQFAKAIHQLRGQDRSLHGPALHMVLVLRKAGILDNRALAPAVRGRPHEAETLDVVSFVSEYVGYFTPRDQLQYLLALDVNDRLEACKILLLQGGAGTNEELLGCIDWNGRHRAGFLEQILQQDGLGNRAEFEGLCASVGRAACERGQYREALQLLHLGCCYSEVLDVLCRCLRMPTWRERPATSADELTLLDQDIQRFFAIYERNLDSYALSSHTWALARKLYAARLFHSLCDQGRPEAALDIFDREQLLPFNIDQPGALDSDGEVLAEYPRIISDYVKILFHAASQGTVALWVLKSRTRLLQSFLAVHGHRLALDQDTVSALAKLALS